MRVSAVSGPEHDNESGHQAFSFKPEDAKPPGVFILKFKFLSISSFAIVLCI